MESRGVISGAHEWDIEPGKKVERESAELEETPFKLYIMEIFNPIQNWRK